MFILLDGLIGEDAICEVKCPYSVKNYESLEKAVLDKKVVYITHR